MLGVLALLRIEFNSKRNRHTFLWLASNVFAAESMPESSTLAMTLRGG